MGKRAGQRNHARAAGVLLYLPAHGACDAGSLCRQQMRGAALYERLGFKDEGTARNAAKKDGKYYYDLHLMSILRSEFFDEN